MDAPQPTTTTHRVVDISFPRLATTLVAFVALMHCHIPTHAESAQGMFGMVTAMIGR